MAPENLSHETRPIDPSTLNTLPENQNTKAKPGLSDKQIYVRVHPPEVPQGQSVAYITVHGRSYVVYSIGVIWGLARGDYIAKSVGSSGYNSVFIGGERLQLARVMLIAFCGLPKRGQVAVHKNDDPLDDRLENLCWTHRSELLACPLTHHRD